MSTRLGVEPSVFGREATAGVGSGGLAVGTVPSGAGDGLPGPLAVAVPGGAGMAGVGSAGLPLATPPSGAGTPGRLVGATVGGAGASGLALATFP